MKKILVVSDAWHPQVNGVVRSLTELAAAAPAQGATISFVTPDLFPNVALPTYREIRLALATRSSLRRAIERLAPDHVHIATEGPLGLAARSVCIAEGEPFTSSYHTRFPEYIFARTRLPLRLTYAALRRFHRAASGVMVATGSLERELSTRGFAKLMRWSRGVDHALFKPRASVLSLPRPIFLFVGRLAIEKNIGAFLSLDLPGSKVVVGDGPDRAALQGTYPHAHFLGARRGVDLAEVYASADVFVFPSLTDTFGLVLLEAMACGVPVAAYPVPGPLDVIGTSGAGVLGHDLRSAALQALTIPRELAQEHARQFSWDASARQFLANIRSARAEFYAA